MTPSLEMVFNIGSQTPDQRERYDKILRQCADLIHDGFFNKSKQTNMLSFFRKRTAELRENFERVDSYLQDIVE